LSVGGSVWYMIRNLRCTVTIDSVLANSKTQNAIFLHDYPLAVEPGIMPRPLVQKKLGEILYLLICSFLLCLSWLLRSRIQKSQRDLWITLYINDKRAVHENECYVHVYWYSEIFKRKLCSKCAFFNYFRGFLYKSPGF